MIKEELMMEMWKPERVQKYVELYGLDWDEYM